MTRKRSLLHDYLVYIAVRFVLTTIQILPWSTLMALANGLAWLAYHLDRRHRCVAHENLRIAFPDMDAQARDQLVRRVYRHFCRVLVTLTLIPRRLHVANWKQHFEPAGEPLLLDALLSGRPVMVVTGHFGNWELGGWVMGLLGFRSWVIARRLDNPFLERFLARFRQGTGQTILDKNEDFAEIQNVLARGDVLVTLGDQDAGQRGLYVNFFERPASTHKAVALLGLEYRALMVVVGVPFVGVGPSPMRHRLEVEDVIDSAEYLHRPDAVRAITERFTMGLERLARRYPEQYFWLHRRWKHQPKVRGTKKVEGFSLVEAKGLG